MVLDGSVLMHAHFIMLSSDLIRYNMNHHLILDYGNDCTLDIGLSNSENSLISVFVLPFAIFARVDN